MEYAVFQLAFVVFNFLLQVGQVKAEVIFAECSIPSPPLPSPPHPGGENRSRQFHSFYHYNKLQQVPADVVCSVAIVSSNALLPFVLYTVSNLGAVACVATNLPCFAT